MLNPLEFTGTPQPVGAGGGMRLVSDGGAGRAWLAARDEVRHRRTTRPISPTANRTVQDAAPPWPRFRLRAIGISTSRASRTPPRAARRAVQQPDRPPVQLMARTPRQHCAFQRSGRRRGLTSGNEPHLTAMGFDPSTTLHDCAGRVLRRRRDDLSGCLFPAGPASHSPAVRGRVQRTAAGYVLPAGRRHAQGDRQARRDRVEPRLRDE
jgi:hypothetical protein